MNKIRKEIECLHRLQELSSSMDEMLAFLFAENLITREEIKGIQNAPDKAKVLQAHLSSISKDNRIQLLEYHWDFLPVERLKVLIVTNRNQKDFSYNF